MEHALASKNTNQDDRANPPRAIAVCATHLDLKVNASSLSVIPVLRIALILFVD